MIQAPSYPPIEELLPHRGTMLLLDRVIAFEETSASAAYAPRADAWYCDHEGNMPAWIGIELMAQTAAVHVALKKRGAGLPPAMGALLGTRCYQAQVASFKGGVALTVSATLILRDASGLGAYDCAIACGETPLASALLKVYEPEDFEQFVQGSLK